jgi:hypothetical protein
MPKFQMSAWERSTEFLRKVLVNNIERETTNGKRGH